MEAMINGIRMHWRERGEGEPVLFIHAFPLHGGMWEEQLERLPRRWRALAPDLRGFGRSEAGTGEEPLSMARMADDLVALLDARGIGRAVVCGLSMGGYIALALWRRHADRVRALVLCNTRADDDNEGTRQNRRELAALVRQRGAVAAADAMVPRMVASRTEQERPEVAERLRAMVEDTAPDVLVRALEGLAIRPDSNDLLPGIDVPTLVVVGSEDAITPVIEAEELARHIPDARLTVIEGAGHISNLENPAAFDTALVQFLEAIEGH